MKIRLIRVGVPLLVPMPFSEKYRLERVLETTYEVDGRIVELEVPVGFITDGASIPRPFWSTIGSPFQPSFIIAAIIHDYCCETGYNVEEMSQLFECLLRDAGVKAGLASLMETAVNLYKTYF